AELDQLDLDVVDLADDLRAPVLGEAPQLLGQIDLGDHRGDPPVRQTALIFWQWIAPPVAAGYNIRQIHRRTAPATRDDGAEGRFPAGAENRLQRLREPVRGPIPIPPRSSAAA